jgi:hypothetical protein
MSRQNFDEFMDFPPKRLEPLWNLSFFTKGKLILLKFSIRIPSLENFGLQEDFGF